jgi:hypothetical protein
MLRKKGIDHFSKVTFPKSIGISVGKEFTLGSMLRTVRTRRFW